MPTDLRAGSEPHAITMPRTVAAWPPVRPPRPVTFGAPLPRSRRGFGWPTSARVAVLWISAVTVGAGATGVRAQPPAEPSPRTPAQVSSAPAFGALAEAFDAERASVEREAAARSQRLDGLARELAALSPGTPDADALDVVLVGEATEIRHQLDRALREWSSPSTVPKLVMEGEPRERGAEIPTGFADARGKALRAEDEMRWVRVDALASALERVVGLRIECMDRLSPARRAIVLGVTREGLAQLRRELETLGLGLRLVAARRRHAIEQAPEAAQDLFTIGGAVTRLVLVAVVLLLANTVRRRWKDWLEELRLFLFRALPGVGLKRGAESAVGLVRVAFPWALFLLTVLALRRAVGPASKLTEIDVLFNLASIYGAYRLAIDLIAAALLGVADRYRLKVSHERRERLLRSIRSMLRVVTLLALTMLVSNRWLGHGYLYHLVNRFAWLVLLVALLLELMRWRRVMVTTFLASHPTGRLSQLVESSQSRWFGALVAPAAMLWLAGRAATTVARDFAMGFEQTQKALAFVFRRRIERRAVRQGYAEGALDTLPASVVEAFAETPVESGPLVVDYFPELDTLHRDLVAWRDGGPGGACILTGERGIGKTSWLSQLRLEGVSVERIEPGGRVTDPGDLCRRLSARLGLGRDCASPEALCRELAGSTPRVVVVDLAQHLFLATVGGYEAFGAFAELVDRTRPRVFWVVAMSAYAWRHLAAVRTDVAVFSRRLHLGPWSEESIRDLIRARRQASGATFNFTELVLDSLEGVSARARLIESEEGYTRLLWDYSDGNPRVALHYFLRSLDRDQGDQLRVRLFRAPDPARIEAGGEQALFVLAAIVTHESICLEDLRAVTRYREPECRIQVDRLVDMGAVTCASEMYRVSTSWHRTIVRLLRRRSILPA